MHFYEDLIKIFEHCFFTDYNTRLAKGEDEPIYLPANARTPHHTIYFAHGFFSSALHECAHWLIAGEERRKLEDFGYWYVPDGRSPEQQLLFQQVEVKPQAIEWILSVAANFNFRISLDNLSGNDPIDATSFEQAVYAKVMEFCEKGLPERVECFRKALCEFYGTSSKLRLEDFETST